MEKAEIIRFPGTEKAVRKERKIRSADGFKYFNEKQIKLLREYF